MKPEGVINEAQRQLAYADKVLVNKTDLASEEEIAGVERAIREVNATAQVPPPHSYNRTKALVFSRSKSSALLLNPWFWTWWKGVNSTQANDPGFFVCL